MQVFVHAHVLCVCMYRLCVLPKHVWAIAVCYYYSQSMYTMYTLHPTGSILSSCVDIPVIIAVSVANILILLVSITLLVIGGVLTCKRRRHPRDKVHFDNMYSKEVMETYDQVDDSIVLKRMAEDYQYVDVRTTKEEDEHEQASTQIYI